MAYVNPQLQEQTTDMILLLKEWAVNTSQKMISKEKYGESICDCCSRKLALANSYINLMQCYSFQVVGSDEPYNCLSEDELKLVLQKSKKITTESC